MKVLITVFIIFLSGCVKESSPISVKCSKEQLNAVEQQFNTCTKSSYLDSFCYDQARLEQCEVKVVK